MLPRKDLMQILAQHRLTLLPLEEHQEC
jgi:hypothetical protein